MRRRRPEKRTILPDPIYKDLVVAQFINYLMKNGKKSLAEKIFYGSLDIISSQLKTDNPIDIFKKAITNTSPNLEYHIWDNVHKGMRDAIISKNGTGKKADINVEGFDLYGKTGTAENPHGDNHAWFVGWADYNNEKYSIVIFGLYHKEFEKLSNEFLQKSLKNNSVIFDLTNKITGENVIHL